MINMTDVLNIEYDHAQEMTQYLESETRAITANGRGGFG